MVFVNDTIHYYDTETGEPLTDEPVLTEELCLKKDQSETETASSHSVVMTGSDEEGILYVNRGGMYLYYPGGTMEKQLFSYGYLFSLDHVFLMNTVETENPEFTHRLFNGQEKNCFAPELILGISAAAREKEAAQMFVEFLFSEEQQKNGKEAGFPVRKAVYESDEYWELGREGSFEGASSATYNGEMTELIDVLHSSDSQLKEIRELGKTLTTPVGRNRVLLDAVKKAGVPYLKNETDLDQAVSETISQVNLYLSE